MVSKNEDAIAVPVMALVVFLILGDSIQKD
jgi:hypothetical protein